MSDVSSGPAAGTKTSGIPGHPGGLRQNAIGLADAIIVGERGAHPFMIRILPWVHEKGR
jgi:hypothetical protein